MLMPTVPYSYGKSSSFQTEERDGETRRNEAIAPRNPFIHSLARSKDSHHKKLCCILGASLKTRRGKGLLEVTCGGSKSKKISVAVPSCHVEAFRCFFTQVDKRRFWQLAFGDSQNTTATTSTRYCCPPCKWCLCLVSLKLIASLF